jgi:AraC family transcriptional regulator of adaptative response / DNA-3-methyladenine glycosylase II
LNVWPVQLTVPKPFQAEALFTFFARHAVPGVEAYDSLVDAGAPRIRYTRTLRLPHGAAAVELSWQAGQLTAELNLANDEDLGVAVESLRDLCDADVDVDAVEAHLRRDPVIGPLVATSPGLRVPGAVDAHEHLFRTMIGQQISLAGAANCAAKLVGRFGEPFPGPVVTRLFPTAAALAAADPETLPMPRARGRALVAVAQALADGSLELNRHSDPVDTRRRLLACVGVGPWTADYVLMRALHAPDILLGSDLVIKRELASRNVHDTTAWSPWRSYATMHLWRAWTG